MLLEKIEQSSDIKKLKAEDYPVLAQEIRQFLLEKISRTGGHLASNLGVVEPLMPPNWRRSSKPSFLPLRILWV